MGIGRNVRDMLWPATPMMRAVPIKIFGLFEIGQHIVPSPTGIAERLPIVEIARLAADINHSIDRSRPADDLPTRPIAAPPAKCFDGFGIVHPIDAPVEKGATVADRHLYPDRQVAAPRFQQEDGKPAIFRQTVGKNTPRCSGADDNIVIFFRHWTGCCVISRWSMVPV